MSEGKGGIGGSNFVELPDEDEPIQTVLADAGPVETVNGQPTDLAERLMSETAGATAAIHALGPMIENLKAEIARVGSENRQIAGQFAQLEQAAQQVNGWAQSVEARLAAMAQQIMVNLRVTALKLATESRYTGEPPEKVIVNATAYLGFLTPPPVPQPLPGEQDAQNEPAKETKH